MRKSYLYAGLLPAAAGFLLTGCVDDGYDVGDIDTTSRIEVKNLVLPLNLDQIKIDKVIELEDNENISIIDGAYAIEKTGEISTSTFKINPIHVNVAPINGNVIHIVNPMPGISSTVDIPAVSIPEQSSSYDLSLRDIDKSLVGLSSIEAVSPIKVAVTLSVNAGVRDALSKMKFEGLKIQLPTGLAGYVCEQGTYNPTDGILTLGSGIEMNNGSLTVALTATGITNSNKIIDHSLSISGTVGILEGAQLSMSTNGNPLPADIDINVAYSIADFDLKSFSGEVNYEMDDIKINPISLTGLPEFLDSPDTEIYLANPTIDININNPVGGYNMAGTGVLSLTSNFSGVGNTSAAEGPIAIEADPSSQKISFNTANMPGLSSILVNKNAGGLPKTINVAVKNLVFAGAVKDFPIGTDIAGAKGDYSFSAPLGFSKGSKIIYERTEDGWYDDDLKGLNIRTINLTAVCSTDLPVGLHLQVYPLDINGNIIPVDENSNHFTVTANSNSEPVMISVKAKDVTISGLDGIRFIATVSQDNEGKPFEKPLGPDQNITLNDLRIKVDGYYEKEF